MDAGTEPLPAAPTAPTAPEPELAPAPVAATTTALPPSVSRYRSLRGKSVSSARTRTFDVFEDSNTDEDGDGDVFGSPTRRRRRSKSVTGPASSSTTGKTPASPSRLRRGAAGFPFPTSASALSPKPINVLLASRPSKAAAKAWADLKPPPSLPVDAARVQALNKNKPKSKPKRPATPLVPVPIAVAPSTPTADTDADAGQHDPATPSAEFGPGPQHRHYESDEESARWAEEVARLEAETDRILAEQKKLDLVRLQATLVTPPPKPKSIIFERLAFFSRSSRKGYGGSQPNTPTTIASTIFSLDFSRTSSPEASPPPVQMSFIEQGGRGIVPQIDAPASAINGGERVSLEHLLSCTQHN